MKKKIAIVGLNYYPEESSTGLYTTEMCDYLQREFDVTVITGYPYYPEWKISDEYINKSGILEEKRNGVEIYRVKQYVPKKVNPLNRLYHYYDFYKKALDVAQKNSFDMMQVILPNIFLLKLAIKMKKLNKTKVIWAHVQDFEIDAGLETLKGIGKIKILRKFLYYIERKLLEKFDIVSSISEGMVKKLYEKGVKQENSYFFPNWSDISKLYKLDKSSYKDELKLKDKKNVILLPLQSKEKLNEFLNLADIHIIPQKKEAKDSFMPSKLLGIMAVEKPVLVLANKESNLYQVIKDENIGYILNETEYNKLSEIIDMISKDEDRIAKGKKARYYLMKNYIYEDIIEKLI